MSDSLHLRSRLTIRGAGENTVLKKDREYRTRLATRDKRAFLIDGPRASKRSIRIGSSS